MIFNPHALTTLALSPIFRVKEKMFKMFIRRKLGSMSRESEFARVEQPEQKSDRSSNPPDLARLGIDFWGRQSGTESQKTAYYSFILGRFWTTLQFCTCAESAGGPP